MTPRELTRRHLEALLVAQAVIRPDVAEPLLAAVDATRVSPPVVALLVGIANEGEDVRPATKGQLEIAERVDRLTVRELRGTGALDFDTLVALVNALPALPVRTPAWERNLAAGLEQGAAA